MTAKEIAVTVAVAAVAATAAVEVSGVFKEKPCVGCEGRVTHGKLAEEFAQTKTSTCAWRPTSAKKGSCGLALADGGVLDIGPGNVMQPGTWAGKWCVERPCEVMAGAKE